MSLFGLLLLLDATSSARAVEQTVCSDTTSCQFLTCKSPASGVPSNLWGDLRPVDTGQLPSDRDDTSYPDGVPGGPPPSETHPLWVDLSIQNNWIFAAISHGMQVWNGAVPNAPVRTAVLGRASFPSWPSDPHEGLPVRAIAAPPNNDGIVAVGLAGGGGLSVFNAANKNSPTARYGDSGKSVEQLHAARINGTDYVFAATKDAGLLAYSLTAAQGLTTLCTESTPTTTTCGVYRGRIGSRPGLYYVTGVGNAAATQHWIAVSGGSFGVRGVEIWNVSNPTSPSLLLTALDTEFVHGLAMWRSGSNYWMAVRTGTNFRIFNVSCIASGSCSSLGSAVFSRNHSGDTENNILTYSSTGSRDFVHVGNFNRCSTLEQNEWLYDVSSPSAAFDITPPDGTIGGFAAGYWGYYYRRNETGFNNVATRVARFNGNYLYRASFAIFDIHQLTSGGPPTCSFTYLPSTVYRGQAVNFSDTSIGAPTQWSWSFQDATPGSSTAQNPSGVIFNSVGTKSVSLSCTNAFGTDSDTQTITVLDPAPAVASVSVSPNPAFVCQPVTFTANSVTGSPTPTLGWTVRNSLEQTVTTGGNVNPFVWDTTGFTAGTYTGQVAATNTAGSATQTSPTLTLNALPTLPLAGAFTPTNDAFTGATVQFHLNVPGATLWCWSFGDGTTFPTGCTSNPALFSNDPVAGPNPTHSYTIANTYTVSVQIRNCVEGVRTSAPLTVVITQVDPLVASFQATTGVSCFGNFCEGRVGTPITFVDSSTGNPTGYAYDFNNTGSTESGCSFGTPSTNPVTSHTYSAVGNFRPCLKVIRGTETDIYLHPLLTISTGGGSSNPVVTVSGPSSGQVGQSLSYTANATNCSPSPTTWTWDAGSDGTISGSATGSTIAVSFGATGTKSVRATAASGGCNGTSGSRSVTISSGGGGGGGGTLDANFTFTPTSPAAGQQVSFDGTSSAGSPTGYLWNFGDGGTANGAQVTHSYANAGTYTVTLEVSKVDANACSSQPLNLCTNSQTASVVVGGDPQPGASFTTSATCGAFTCTANARQAVTFTSTSTNTTQHDWNFGDGTTASGINVSHTWNQVGTYNVTLTARNATGGSSQTSRLLEITQPAVADRVVVLPWIADTSGALNQKSDVYVTNPSNEAMDVEVVFRKRGTPEDEPPTLRQTIAPNATFYSPNLLEEAFGRGDSVGFLVITAEQAAEEPVVVSLNETLQSDGSTYGQSVLGIGMDELDQVAGGVGSTQFLLGLTDTDEKHSFIGLTNPHGQGATYRLRFLDKLGNVVAASSQDLGLGPWGQKQFQIQELRDSFGVEGLEDYRVEIVQTSGLSLYAYGGIIRQGTQDPAFVQVSLPTLSKVYLVGAASTPGFNNAFFLTDAVLSNPTSQVMQLDVSYRNVGNSNTTLGPVTITLLPNETQRITDVLFDRFGVVNSVGVLILEGEGANGRFPLIHGETYQNTGPGTQYGLFMPARAEREIANVGQRVFLSGLRQLDDAFNTTIWLFNPSEDAGLYDVVYYSLEGHELGRLADYGVPPGGIRQLNPSRHPLPAGGVAGGFTVAIEVKSGQLFAGGQVVINQSNDPAYVTGAVR